MRRVLVAMICSLALVPATLAAEASLRGSRAGMIQQNSVAVQHGLRFHRTVADVRRSVERGDLVELSGNEDYRIAEFVAHPFLVPEGRLFVERTAARYREACGEQLVVTSATRATARQPRNAHALSVHPAGMAVDLRVSRSAACRGWLENELLDMERQGLINGIREFRPPHYHVAIFPGAYGAYAAERMAAEEAARLEKLAQMAAAVHLAPVTPFRAPETGAADQIDPPASVWTLAIPPARFACFAAEIFLKRIVA